MTNLDGLKRIANTFEVILLNQTFEALAEEKVARTSTEHEIANSAGLFQVNVVRWDPFARKEVSTTATGAGKNISREVMGNHVEVRKAILRKCANCDDVVHSGDSPVLLRG